MSSSLRSSRFVSLLRCMLTLRVAGLHALSMVGALKVATLATGPVLRLRLTRRLSTARSTTTSRFLAKQRVTPVTSSSTRVMVSRLRISLALRWMRAVTSLSLPRLPMVSISLLSRCFLRRLSSMLVRWPVGQRCISMVGMLRAYRSSGPVRRLL